MHNSRLHAKKGLTSGLAIIFEYRSRNLVDFSAVKTYYFPVDSLLKMCPFFLDNAQLFPSCAVIFSVYDIRGLSAPLWHLNEGRLQDNSLA